MRVTGRINGENRSIEWCVWAHERGEIIPAIPAAIAARMLLSGRIAKVGIVAPNWLDSEVLFAELAARGISVATRRTSAGAWQLVHPSAGGGS